MKLITRPDIFDGEASGIAALFRAGLPTLHLRKPDAPIEAVRALLRSVPEEFHDRIVLHDCFSLTRGFALRGVHLNGRNPEPPGNHCGSVSRSCHDLDEVRRYKPSCDYVTLSPVFDSISKRGYASAFALPQLEMARAEGIIDDKVIALGGVTADRLPAVRNLELQFPARRSVVARLTVNGQPAAWRLCSARYGARQTPIPPPEG